MQNFIIKTLGCKTNQIESAIIEEKLLQSGFNLIQKTENADYFILNSCSVTDNADSKALSTLKSIKKENPNIKTVLTGCFAQLDFENLKNNPNVDILVGNAEKLKIAEIIKTNTNFVVSDIFESEQFCHETLNTIRKSRATIKIQDGCDNRCAYCTIPLARGKNRSNSIKNIIEQIATLKEHGYEEVVFTGIHIGQWGYDFGEKNSLLHLLEEVEKTDITRYRLGSLNPLELDDNLLKFLAKSNKFCPHFHISLQSACDKTLKNMNRHYSYGLAKTIIDKINTLFINPFIGSDVIVGFPGETQEDFLTTADNLNNTNLSQIHVFPYSKRKNTTAAEMQNQVPAEIKKERVTILKNISDAKHLDFLKRNIGSKAEIIVENNKDKSSGLYKGVTRNYINVLIEGEYKNETTLKVISLKSITKDNKKLIGKFVN